MATRARYIISGQTLEAVVNDLNFYLQSISDRLDKLEGIRGKPSLSASAVSVTGEVSVVDDDETEIHRFR